MPTPVALYEEKPRPVSETSIRMDSPSSAAIILILPPSILGSRPCFYGIFHEGLKKHGGKGVMTEGFRDFYSKIKSVAQPDLLNVQIGFNCVYFLVQRGCVRHGPCERHAKIAGQNSSSIDLPFAGSVSMRLTTLESVLKRKLRLNLRLKAVLRAGLKDRLFTCKTIDPFLLRSFN